MPDLVTIALTGNFFTRLYEVFYLEQKRQKRQETETVAQRNFQIALQQQAITAQREAIEANHRHALHLLEKTERFRRYPLTMTPDQIIERVSVDKGPAPLLVVCLPPRLRRDRTFNNDDRNRFPNIEYQLHDTIKENLTDYINANELITISGLWSSSDFYGEAAINQLHDGLRNLPVLVIETIIENDNLAVYVGFWTDRHQNPTYMNLFRESFTAILNNLARSDAQSWGEIRERYQPNDDGKLTLEQKRREENWQLLQQELQDQNEGILGKEHLYHVSISDVQKLFITDITMCYTMIAGWITDAYLLRQEIRPPRLPSLLPNLIQDQVLTRQFSHKIVSEYRRIFTMLEPTASFLIPSTRIALAEILHILGDAEEAKKELQQAMYAWIRARSHIVEQETDLVPTIISLRRYEDIDEQAEIEQMRTAIITILGDHETAALLAETPCGVFTRMDNYSEDNMNNSSHLPEQLQRKLQEFEQLADVLRTKLSTQDMLSIDEDIQRLRNLNVTIAAFGEINAGKSSLLNALLGYRNDDAMRPFGASPVPGTWDDYSETNNGVRFRPDPTVDVELIIYDAPGIAGDNPDHIAKARTIAQRADVILYVVWQAVKGHEQTTAIRELIATGKPVLVVLSKVDIQRESEIEAVKSHLQTKIPQLSDDAFVRTAADPQNGSETGMAELKQSILSIVEHGRLSLITHTLDSQVDRWAGIAEEMIAQELRQIEAAEERKVRARERDLMTREDRAKELVTNYARGAGAAAGLVPFGIDFLLSTLISGGMLVHTLRVFDKKMEPTTLWNFARSLIAAFFSVLAVSGLTLAVYQAISKGAKSNPFTYALGMTMDAVFTYFIVQAIGQAFIYYCRNDLSWGAKRSAEAFMRDFVKENVDDMFVNRIPSRFREKFAIDPDKL